MLDYKITMNLNIFVLWFLPIIWCLPSLPPHTFEKRVLQSKKSVHDEDIGDHTITTKKVFVTFIQGPYVFKKRREKGNRVTFTCNGCQKVGKYLPVVASRDSDPEHDEYTLDGDTLPGQGDHLCGNSGIEDMVRQFKKEIEAEIRSDPTQPFPALYLAVRSKYTSKLSCDAKLVFLAEIPPYDSMATSMYRIRRLYIPPAPLAQAGLDVSLDWFLVSPTETIVKGDVLHSDGLRVLLFATDESLQIMARARTILADGTFKITPYLWYQTFILSAEYREFQFVPVAFALLPDKKTLFYTEKNHKFYNYLFSGGLMMIYLYS